jgi:hypothetical protein
MFQVLVADLSLQRLGLNPMAVHIGYAMDKMTVGQVSFYEYIGFSVSVSFSQCFIPFLSPVIEAG